VCLDGKTFRGTVPHGASQGLHLLTAYVPGTGVVLQAGWSNLAQARRRYAAHPDEGLPLLLKTPGGSSPAS
jgi:hypothetical protein